MNRTLLSTALLLLLAACTREGAPADAPATVDAPPPPLDQPAEDVPPATASPSGGSLHVGLPAEGTIGFEGFGPARFGATAEEVRMAWGGDLGEPQPSEPGGCYYLMPQPSTDDGYRVAFMIEGERFARIDIRADAVTAPGGGKVGMSADEIRGLYGDRVESGHFQELPHKYTDGKYLRIADAASGNALVFETDADGTVDEWRIGTPPQVDYVEGCS
jgi:hypothetical protein